MAQEYVAENYEGTDTYKYIDGLLRKRSNELLVITPFLGPSYASALWKEAGKKKVYVVISNSKINSKAWKLLSHGRLGGYARAFAYLAVLSALLFYLKLKVFAFGTVALLAAVLLLAIIRRSKRGNLHVKISDRLFIHEKLYITDTEAISGSANLTYGGTHRNLEQIAITHDPSEIRRLKEHFWAVWGSKA